MTPQERAEMRRLIADYISSEGCACCRGDAHEEHAAAIAKAIGVRKYSDGSGYDFGRYKSRPRGDRGSAG